MAIKIFKPRSPGETVAAPSLDVSAWLPDPDLRTIIDLFLQHHVTTITLTEQRQNGRLKTYKKCIGKVRDKAGSLVPRVLPLGLHKGRALT